MKKFYFLYCWLLLLGTWHCRKISCLENDGSMTITHRNIAPFHQISLSDNINLVLTQDTTESVRVEAGKNVQPNVEIFVDKGILSISNQAGCSSLKIPSKQINVFVSVKNLDRIEYKGSGTITSVNTIQADTLTLYSDRGAGNIDITLHARITTATIQNENADFVLHGKSVVCYAYTNARGTFNFTDFKVENMHIGFASVQDAVINASNTLEATLYHTGNLYYKGKPTEIITQYYSSGRLLPAP